MNSAAASVPAISAPIRRITAAVPATPQVRGRGGHGRWLVTAAAAAVVILTALTFVLNALEAQESVEYGTTAPQAAAEAGALAAAR